MRLFSYCLRYDNGAAPNPYWGICTLVICKPAIRRSAQIGDWIVGLGSANSPISDISTSVVYAMKVTSKLTMMEYDQFCRTALPKKIPQLSRDYRLQRGDCIYQYDNGRHPKMRWGPHCEINRERDLSGKYALLSKEFYYFGDQPVPLPEYLYPIIHATQGHKSNRNESYVQSFVDWIEHLGYRKNELYGKPQYEVKQLRALDIQPPCSPRYLQQKEIRSVARSC